VTVSRATRRPSAIAKRVALPLAEKGRKCGRPRAFFRATFDPAYILESSMLSHKFQIGELVRPIPAISRHVSGGSYEITKKLPERNGEFEYQMKSVIELYQRVARESELQGV
jgi:hypothetical protein